MVIIACGGRDFAGDAAKRDVCRALDRLNEAKGVDLVIHGAARGADSLASWWASSRQVQQEAFEVTSDDWNMYRYDVEHGFLKVVKDTSSRTNGGNNGGKVVI